MLQLSRRLLSSIVGAGEARLTAILQKTFPAAEKIVVHDTSNGCGSMYQVIVETSEFKGLSKVQQHKAVTAALKEEIKEMHGLTIETKVARS
ncbi:hypothetical protein PRIPAC_86339 [Pristionchus pacificus]|uniref:Uncharacterized protein n=1 Tax=Pristionchus pacificus TaxID=54126 RepID=A0A2A6BTF4_PRIPA|nr:hypothetical protein PRIPAC_86339 [Pristionchus pacificus]|eukprot:PDM69096.1 hypothetical protein PRIPAC_47398 [Pristionchus pacificus]